MTSRTVEDLPTPARLVDLDRFEANIAAAAGMVRGTGTHLRPHAKAHRTPALALRQLGPEPPASRSPRWERQEVLVAAGVTDVLVANELIVPQQLERVAALARDAAVSVTVDSRSGADTLSAAAASPGVTLGGWWTSTLGSDGAACRTPPQRASCLVPSWPSGTFAWTGLMG